MRRVDQDIGENIWRVIEDIDEDPIQEGCSLKDLRHWTDQINRKVG